MPIVTIHFVPGPVGTGAGGAAGTPSRHVRVASGMKLEPPGTLRRESMKVVVVESPAKAKTINKYLGSDYTVLASYGHVRDLPAKDGSVRPDDDFAMDWEVDGKSSKRLSDIAAALKGAAVERVVFNAITRSAVTEAMKHPRAIDMELVEAYLARRALDYLVGFALSPVLWRKLPGSRSAGR